MHSVLCTGNTNVISMANFVPKGLIDRTPDGAGPQTTTVNPSLGVQRVFHAGRWWDAARHARLDLPVGTRIGGPAILEQPDTTVWLEPGFSATVDPLGNLLVRADAVDGA